MEFSWLKLSCEGLFCEYAIIDCEVPLGSCECPRGWNSHDYCLMRKKCSFSCLVILESRIPGAQCDSRLMLIWLLVSFLWTFMSSLHECNFPEFCSRWSLKDYQFLWPLQFFLLLLPRCFLSLECKTYFVDRSTGIGITPLLVFWVLISCAFCSFLCFWREVSLLKGKSPRYYSKEEVLLRTRRREESPSWFSSNK